MMCEADTSDLSPSMMVVDVSENQTQPDEECEVNIIDNVTSNLNTSDEVGSGEDLETREDIGRGDANTSTDAVHSDQEIREDELDENDEVPEIKSKLSFKEETENETSRNSNRPLVQSQTQITPSSMATHNLQQARREGRQTKPVEIKPVHIGDQKLRSKLKFDVVTAKVVEEQGKKHVAYTIMMKRAGGEVQPAVISRRYNDFCYLYEKILCTFHPSILGEFQFPKKVLIGNFKAETITERTDAFHKFLNLIASSDKLLYSDYFHAFLCSDEQNEAVSYIKLGKYEDAAPLLETIFYIREKLVTISHVTVLECVVELVACLAAVESDESAFRYALVAAQCLQLLHGHPEVDRIRIPFLKLAGSLAVSLGHDPKPYNKQLSELRYSGIKTDSGPSLLEVIRDKYIHTATRTARAW